MTTAFPLRNAYPFAELKGLAAEIQKIRSSVTSNSMNTTSPSA